MEAVLLRTGSFPSLEALASPRFTSSLSVHDRHGHGNASDFNSLKLSFSPKLNFGDRKSKSTIRRAMSESDMRYGDETTGRLWIGSGSRSAKIEEWWPVGTTVGSEVEGMVVKIGEYCEDVEAGVTGGGTGKGKKLGGGGSGGGFGRGNDGDSNRNVDLDLYYKQMLKMNPMDPLLLRNYAKFLHEVMKDTSRADEYYGRAILANPKDGEVLGLYAKFIWEMQKDRERAKSYFDQAVHISPENCMVMGMYAEFMWENEEDEEDEDVMKMNEASLISSTSSLASIAAY